MSLHPIRPVTRLHPAILGQPATEPLPAYSRLTASAEDGDVVIRVDPGTARDLAEAWSTLHAVDGELERIRPRWFDEVVHIHTAATTADLERGDVPDTVHIPFLKIDGSTP